MADFTTLLLVTDASVLMFDITKAWAYSRQLREAAKLCKYIYEAAGPDVWQPLAWGYTVMHRILIEGPSSSRLVLPHRVKPAWMPRSDS